MGVSVLSRFFGIVIGRVTALDGISMYHVGMA